MRKWIAKFLLHTMMGFRYDSDYPHEVKKSVIIAMPHTSNWDFPLGVILKWWGGVPVDRSKNTNFVDAMAALFEGKESFKITIAPEGTRKKVDKLKSGFYYIALKAKVPIVCCKFDWGKKVIGFSKPFYPTGDYEKDLPLILAYFKGVRGKNEGDEYNIE